MHRTVTIGAIAAASLAITALPAAGGGGIPQGDIVIELEPVAGGLTAPVKVTHAGDGSGRLFIVEQSGQVRIVQDGALLPAPFLDIADRLVDLGTFFDERGLLGMAFHPDYASNGRLFVRYSAPRVGGPDEPCSDPDAFIPGCHRAVVSELHVSAADPNLADPDSETILFTVDEPQFNHNGGDIAFGPDGYLYFALGDGGGAHDGLADVPVSHGPFGNGQNIGTVLGAMIRIDVDPPDDGGDGGDHDDDDDGGDDDGDDDDGGGDDDDDGYAASSDDDDDDDDDHDTGDGREDAFLARTCTIGLDAGQEVPPVSSSGSALACVTVDLENMELAWFIAYQGLTSDVVAAHFHGAAPAGQNAGVVIDIGALSGLDNPIAGSVAIMPDQASEILDGLWYVNVHTVNVPSGEIRGQLDPCVQADLEKPPRLYGVPDDNPFVDAPGRDEIFAYGFRNPYRFSFDDGPGGDGSLYVGDVGQNLFEEVDVVHLGGNYGWVLREGFSCFDPSNPTMPPAACADTGPLGEPLLEPVADYDHGDGLSVIGGFVYRGDAFPDLFGTYVFGDFSTEFTVPGGRLFYIDQAPAGAAIREFVIGIENRAYGLFLKGFGEDEDGNLYVCGSGELAPFGTAGVIERITAIDAIDAKGGTRGVVPVRTRLRTDPNLRR